jgi:hypothetical protein
MKKIILYSILLPLFGLWACDKEAERPGMTTSEIALLAPANNTAFDLENTLNIAFAWEEAFLVDRYELVFSIKEDLSDPIVMSVSRTPFLVSAVNMNNIATALGIPAGEQKNIYWSVQSGRPSQPSTANANVINITKLAAALVAPSTDSKIVLDYEAPDTEVEFSWEPMPINDYRLIISANMDMSDPLIDMPVSTTSAPVTHQTLQALIENPANGLKRYKSNTLYWNVRAGDKILASTPWKFSLYGTRVFTDVRPGESITYQVSVVPNGAEEMVWMSENLRTTKLVNGTDLVHTDQYIPATEAMINATTPVPEPIRRHAGAYYRVRTIGDNSVTVQWPALLAPAGWKVPELEDFSALAAAASQVSPGMEVLRHIDGYPALAIAALYLNRDLMNQWNMNMVPCGTNRITGASTAYIIEFAQLNFQHMVYAFNSVSQCITVEQANLNYGNARAIGLGDDAPIVVRLLYTGDD